MFDFETLDVYKDSKSFHLEIHKDVLLKPAIDNAYKYQLRRSSLSLALNIAEGSGRFSKADKRNFYVIARSSLIESIAILDILKDLNLIEIDIFQKMYFLADKLSRMLFVMITQLQK
ncbi:MAG: four helix bundle protein [Bacteroidetes bacterium]|nr:MAG: four helix bundle protein [Bacteroidota bacterium]REK08176.1 MAG: four helix bundle protein [Bacteroidota bacterium]REK32381.1 MAG: four helix bundle protein [Bacteroidota bacterium]REK49615.1 MAG: four helix bundle protein [Bacteroidota bacterium]